MCVLTFWIWNALKLWIWLTGQWDEPIRGKVVLSPYGQISAKEAHHWKWRPQHPTSRRKNWRQTHRYAIRLQVSFGSLKKRDILNVLLCEVRLDCKTPDLLNCVVTYTPLWWTGGEASWCLLSTKKCRELLQRCSVQTPLRTHQIRPKAVLVLWKYHSTKC